VPAYGPQNDVTLKMPAFEWVHVQLHQQKGMISLSPPTICNSADELVPQPGDIVLPKPRYSGFFNTPLDSILRSRGIRHLVFTGIATNVCVESTLRDGFFLEYFGVVLEDATHQAGPEFAQKAALFNIETFFGWVSDVETFCDALSPTSFARIA
ncbi:isochorismatase family protein, partial [Escherichia coli]|uniref:isochorismatase family protein n=1 Tax=Escherichia coli TaxID=562 RepID=UPI003856007E